MKLDEYALIYETSTEPTEDQLDVSSLTSYSGSAAFESGEGASTTGSIFFDTNTDLITYKNNSGYITLNDHDSLLNKGTTSHSDLDSHYGDGTLHFEMLDEDDMLSNSDTKCPTQQSVKAYLAANEVGLASYEYNENIGEGDLLKIINDSGAKVEKIVWADTLNLGSEAQFEDDTATDMDCCFDSVNNKVVIVWRGTSNYGKVVVGTIVGTAISFGTVETFNSAASYSNVCTFDTTNNKVVIAYRDGGNSDYGTAIVGTVSGTSISFGSEALFTSSYSNDISICYDSVDDNVIVAYQDAGNSFYGTAVVGTVSGTSISFGTPVVFNGGRVDNISCAYDIFNEKVLIVYADDVSSGYSYSIVGTVSGTSISFGSETLVLTSHTGYSSSCVYDPINKKIIVLLCAISADYYIKTLIGTISGTSVTYSDAYTLVNGSSNGSVVDIDYDSTQNIFIITYSNPSDGQPYVVIARSDGYYVSYETPIKLVESNGYHSRCAYDSNEHKSLMIYRNSAGYGESIVGDFDGPSLFAGIAQEAGTTGTSHPVAILYETSEVHSGETPGTKGYIQSDGTLGTTATAYPIGIFTSETNFEIYKDDQE